VLGLLATADFSWARAEHGLLASRPEASPPPENKFHGDGAPVRTQGLERGWLRLKRAELPPNRSVNGLSEMPSGVFYTSNESREAARGSPERLSPNHYCWCAEVHVLSLSVS
jgi:hypothetical protein